MRVQRKDGDIVECPDIVTENLKEAEHLAATLALYRLCKGQRVYQLLPPPYRDVWLEWQDAEDRGSAEAKAEKNKVMTLLNLCFCHVTKSAFSSLNEAKYAVNTLTKPIFNPSPLVPFLACLLHSNKLLSLLLLVSAVTVTVISRVTSW